MLEWLPFGVSFIGVVVNGIATISEGPSSIGLTFFYTIGISTLLFGLLARLQRPDDQAARIIIAVGASMVLLGIFAGDGIDADRESRTVTITTNVLNHFDGDFAGGLFKGAMFKVYALLLLVMCLVATACAVFVVPARKLPPALQAVDAFAPHATAALLVWLPVQIVLFMLALLIHGDHVKFVEWFLMLVRSLLMLLAFSASLPPRSNGWPEPGATRSSSAPRASGSPSGACSNAACRTSSSSHLLKSRLRPRSMPWGISR